MTQSVWSWEFGDMGELRRALEEYTSFQEGVKLRRYGHSGLRMATDELGRPIVDEHGHELMVPDPDPEIDPEKLAELEMCKARIRSEIDHSMEALRRQYPHLWGLIDVYYRHGLSLEPRGWLIPAIKYGIHQGRCPDGVRCPASPGDNREDLSECKRAHKQHCFWDRDTFERQLTCAVRALFRAHKVRSRRTA